MPPSPWSSSDLEQLRSAGIDPSEASRQMEFFRRPPVPLELVRPATVGDGILRLDGAQVREALERFERAARAGRFLKFVPASGAASRMFKILQSRSDKGSLTRGQLEKKAAEGDLGSKEILRFFSSLHHVAFCGDLVEALRRMGKDVDVLLGEGNYGAVLEGMLAKEGLGLADKPKGLIKFHAYGTEERTPFQEHLVEAIHTIRDDQKRCRLHFTVSPEHRRAFETHLEEVRPSYERAFGVRLEVGFSEQKPSTQTLAADDRGEPFRSKGGWFKPGPLLLRPGGHGALLENLNDLRGDLVLIKNVDNVAVSAALRPVLHWKRVLGGRLLAVQETLFSHLERLAGSPGGAEVAEAAEFVRATFGLDPGAAGEADSREAAGRLTALLDRPLRVCGVVPNTGEPGGGPFWVKGRDGRTALQVVESAEVAEDEGQRGIFGRGTHFNPVDLACGVRDRHGKPYDLRRFSDPKAVFISRKSHAGRELRALELPGLWNGAMAGWLTLFVEVPLETFNPVKTVLDLLRPAHQNPGFPGAGLRSGIE